MPNLKPKTRHHIFIYKNMDNEKDIVYSQSIKAGKRIYYLDVKRNKRGELFLAITESKKIINGEGPDAPYTFEKHKIFLYQEDFTKFIGALSKSIGYIHENQTEGYRYPAGEVESDKWKDKSIQPEEAHDPQLEIDNTPLDESLSHLGEEIDIKIDFE